ncbi:uncharacterized protein [Symphalangus syndactylus]|uniref:uncharacterized protein isoform X3 n=1 Tax=Symphalangus syndactylus TaxID=9590 RepID=UPI0030078CA5
MRLAEAGRRWPAHGGASPWLTFLSASVRTGETFVQLSIKLSLEPQRMDFQQVLECGFLASSRRQNSSRAFLLLRKLQLFPLQQSLDLSQPYECVWVLEEFFSRCCISALGCHKGITL